MRAEYHAASSSSAEDLFIELFSDTFGAEKAGYLYTQYHFYDIYQNERFADFFLESGGKRIAIEIDDEASHNPTLVSRNKFYDDLLKQNSMIHLGWDVYRLSDADDRRAGQSRCCRRKAAQISVDAQFLRVQTEIEYMIA